MAWKELTQKERRTRQGGIRTSNSTELVVVKQLTDAGYQVYKRGWPDFLAIGPSGIRFIEVKPVGSRSNGSPVQRRVAYILKKMGITVELVKGDLANSVPMV
ncbi:MAG: hypothetical protein WC822_02430 [Candidatus Paceibacterota bacterium]|jgi:hypothetical protein